METLSSDCISTYLCQAYEKIAARNRKFLNGNFNEISYLLKIAFCAEKLEIAEDILENFLQIFPEFSVSQSFIPLIGYENVTDEIPYWSAELASIHNFKSPPELLRYAMHICDFISKENWNIYNTPSIEEFQFGAVFHIEKDFKNQIKWANLLILPEL